MSQPNINVLLIGSRGRAECLQNTAINDNRSAAILGGSEDTKRYSPMNSAGSTYIKIDAPKDAVAAFLLSADGAKGAKYRFRSECRPDAELFFAVLNEYTASRSITSLGFGEVEGEFVLAKQLSPQDLLWAACQVPDGHVLVQTLELRNNYTGERDYGRHLNGNPEVMPCAAVRRQMRRGAKAHVDSLKFFLRDAKDFAASI
jgi:hypothetical protein